MIKKVVQISQRLAKIALVEEEKCETFFSALRIVMDSPKYMKRKVKPGRLDVDFDTRSLIVNYEVEATVLGDYGAEMQTERRSCCTYGAIAPGAHRWSSKSGSHQRTSRSPRCSIRSLTTSGTAHAETWHSYNGPEY